MKRTVNSKELIAKENTSTAPDVVRKVNITTLSRKKKTPFPLALVLSVALITVIGMIVVSDYVILSESTLEIAQLKAEIRSLSAEQDKLVGELERKNNMLAIDDFCQNELGMVKEDQVEKEYINVDDTDVIEAYDNEEKKGNIFTTILNALSENFVDAWNTLTNAE